MHCGDEMASGSSGEGVMAKGACRDTHWPGRMFINRINTVFSRRKVLVTSGIHQHYFMTL